MFVMGDISINHSKRNYFLLFTFIASTVCTDGCLFIIIIIIFKEEMSFSFKRDEGRPLGKFESM